MAQNFLIKDLILGLLVILFGLAAFWLWYGVIPLIIDGQFNQYQDYLRSVGFWLVAAVVFVFSSIFIKNGAILLVAALISTLLPFFLLQANSYIIGMAAAAIFLMVIAIHRIKKEFLFSPRFSMAKIARAGLPLYFTSASLVISAFYLANMDEEKAIAGLLPRSVLEFSLEKFSEPISTFTGLPKITPEATLDEILYDAAVSQLEAQGIPLGQLPKKEILGLVATQRKQLSEQFGIDLPGNRTVTDVFYTSLDERLRDLLGPYKKYLPLASAIAFFFAVKTLTFPLYFLSVVLLLLLIYILRLVKIIKSEKVQIEVERLTI